MDGSADRATAELVARALAKDPRIDTSETRVSVQDGIVYLSGIVDSAAERQAAREAAATAVEPWRVVDRMDLRNFVERSDEALRSAVVGALIRDITVDHRPIRVAAHEGVVELEGSVASYAQKSSAENTALWTPGVVEVRSRLRVDIPELPEDEDY